MLRKRIDATVAYLVKHLPVLQAEAKPPDSFWTWYPGFSRLLQDPRAKVDRAYRLRARSASACRKVEGQRLSDLTAGEIFLYKEDLARHRALSILLNDYDRKIDNYMVGKDGRLFTIDAAFADVRGQVARMDGRPPHSQFYMEGAYGRDHWLSRFYKDEEALGPKAPLVELWKPEKAFLRKGLVAEEALTYQDAKPAIEDIKQLVANEPRLRGILAASFTKIYGSSHATAGTS